MKFSIAVLLAAFAISTLGCGYGSNYNSNMMGGTVPNISQLAPNSMIAGGQMFGLTVNGTGFGHDSVVYWAGTPQTTTFITAQQLMATIPASEIASPTMVDVYVRSNNRNSNMTSFTVN